MRIKEYIQKLLDDLVSISVPGSRVRKTMLVCRKLELTMTMIVQDFKLTKRPRFVLFSNFVREYPQLFKLMSTS